MVSAKSPAVHMRAAESGDSEKIACVVNDAFRPERFFIDADRTNPEKIRALLKSGQFLLAEENDILLGCVYVEVRENRGYFGLLAVDPKRQRLGIAKFLIAAAEEHCRKAGCHFIDLTVVNLRTELPPIYRRLGYQENGTLPFPSDQAKPNQPCHLVKMTKPLL